MVEFSCLPVVQVVLVLVSHCNVISGSPIISDYTRLTKALEMEKEVSRISKPANIGRVVGALTYETNPNPVEIN